MNSGLRPVWVLTSATVLADFAVIPGIEALTIIDDDTQAVAAVSARWRAAGCEVVTNEAPPRDVEPRGGDP